MRASARRHASIVCRRSLPAGLLPLALALCALSVPPQSLRGDEPADAERGDVRQVASEESAETESNAELEKRVRVLQKGNSSRSSRRTAMASLPLDKLNETDQQRAIEILRNAALFRELPLLECDVEPEVYQYFTQHPDVAVSIWRAMKISVFQMKPAGEKSYDVDSGDGTTGKVDVLFQTGEESLILCDGLFKTPLMLKPINAVGLFHLQTKLTRREDGTSVATHHGRMFVAFPSQTVGTVAKVVSPVSNVIIDRNFREVSLFLHMMSLAMQRQPGWIEQITRKLEGVPAGRKVELLTLTAEVYVAARKRELAAGGQPIDDVDFERLLPPTAPPTDDKGRDTPRRIAAQPMPASN